MPQGCWLCCSPQETRPYVISQGRLEWRIWGVARVGCGTDKFCQIYSTLYPIRRITRPYYQIQRAVYVLLYRLLPATIPLLVGSSEETEVRLFGGKSLHFPFLVYVAEPNKKEVVSTCGSVEILSGRRPHRTARVLCLGSRGVPFHVTDPSFRKRAPCFMKPRNIFISFSLQGLAYLGTR